MSEAPSPGAFPAVPPIRMPGPLAVPGDDRRWRHLTEKANRAYSRGDAAEARAIYLRALEEADRLFEAALDRSGALPAPVIYNISCHNLAELEERAGDAEAAEHHLRRAYERLVEAARSTACPLDLRVSCVQHLRHALAVLVRHLRRTGAPDQAVDALVSRAHATAFGVLRIAQHARIADARPDCTGRPS